MYITPFVRFSFTIVFYGYRNSITFSSKDGHALWESYCFFPVPLDHCSSNMASCFQTISVKSCESAVVFPSAMDSSIICCGGACFGAVIPVSYFGTVIASRFVLNTSVFITMCAQSAVRQQHACQHFCLAAEFLVPMSPKLMIV